MQIKQDIQRLDFPRTVAVVLGVGALSLLLATGLLRVPVPHSTSALALESVAHAVVEWTSVGIGCVTALLALLYWWVFRRTTLPALLGAIFGFAGLLDGVQTLFDDQLLGAVGGAGDEAARLLVRVFLATGYVLLACCGRQDADSPKGRSLRLVWLVDASAILTALAIVALGLDWLASPPEGAMRVLRWAPGLLFAAALLLGSRHRHQLSRGVPPIAVALLASLVPQLLAESLAFGVSGELTDTRTLAAHGLKLFAALLPLAALALELGLRQRSLLEAAERLNDAHGRLDRQNTDLERAQQLLTHQQEQLGMAMAAGGTGSFVWHVEEDALVLDEHLRQKLDLDASSGGLSREDFVARVHEQDRAAFGASVEAGLSGQGPIASRFRFRSGAAELVLSCAGVVHRDPSGQPLKVVGVLSDVTRQARAESERRQADLRIRRFLDVLPLGVFVEDSEGATYYVNDRARELLGREQSMHPEEPASEQGPGGEDLTLIGHVADTLDGEQRLGRVGRRNLERLPLVRAYGGEESVEEVEVTVKGDKRIVRMWGAPIFGEGEEVEFAMAVLQDITDMKQLEAERMQGQKLEAIGQLAAGIAHEINTPTQYVSDNTHFFETAFKRLGPFLDAAEAMVAADKAGEVTPAHFAALKKTARKAKLDFVRREVPKAIEQSLEGLERVATIVRAMKEFSHPGGGGMSPTDLNRAVKTTVTVARNEWKYVAEVEFDLADDLPSVPVLPDELNQVILNIVVNAAHAIGEKLGEGSAEKGTIKIATRLVDDHVEIRISDDGTGVPAAIQERVFDPFFTTKPVGKGTGQGLAIARKVMLDGHHGDLKLESVEGEGATFTLVLPLEQADTAEGAEEAAE
ncbi:MAG: hypothetical protein GXP55_12020 [Deltaproteobacteria bacterium]|nr:hypothetical protein [Deltaproteobacteria bacterium]